MSSTDPEGGGEGRHFQSVKGGLRLQGKGLTFVLCSCWGAIKAHTPYMSPSLGSRGMTTRSCNQRAGIQGGAAVLERQPSPRQQQTLKRLLASGGKNKTLWEARRGWGRESSRLGPTPEQSPATALAWPKQTWPWLSRDSLADVPGLQSMRADGEGVCAWGGGRQGGPLLLPQA